MAEETGGKSEAESKGARQPALQPRPGKARQLRRSKERRVLAVVSAALPEGVGQLRQGGARQLRTPRQPRAMLTARPQVAPDVIKTQLARRMQFHQLANPKSRAMAISQEMAALRPKVARARPAQVRQRVAMKLTRPPAAEE